MSGATHINGDGSNGNGGGSGTVAPTRVKVAILGAGFSGLGAAIRLRQAGIDDIVVLERAESVGGTWRDNSYPGCGCDVPSHLYSFSFAPNPRWSKTFSPQPEIWEYLKSCAERFGVTPKIRFGHEVLEAAWSNAERQWTVHTSRGTFVAQHLIVALGPLAEPVVPQIAGVDRFEGKVFHSARWDHGHDLTGKRVAVIGTGASSIQLVPKIRQQAQHVTVFQRTPVWVLPHTNRSISRLEQFAYARFPAVQRAVRGAVYASREFVVPGMRGNPVIQRILRWYGRKHLERSVEDPYLRLRLTPKYDVGCKRILISNTYLRAFNSRNVTLETSALQSFGSDHVISAAGNRHEVDTVIFATGFHVTDSPALKRIRGASGRSLADIWQGSPQVYKGTTFPGFPNMFVMVGPNTGLGHNSIVYMIESQLNYVVDAITKLDASGAEAFDLREDALSEYNASVQKRMPGTVWNSGGCASWYIDAAGRNSTIWPDFTWRFRNLTREFDAGAYRLLAPRSPDELIEPVTGPAAAASGLLGA